MLKIECSGCNEWVHMPFDIETAETVCPKCSRTIPVKDVYISAGPYMIHRDVLIKHLYRYKKLLTEAEREFGEIKGRKDETKGAEVTARSINMFISHLKEMLSGCRTSQRHPLAEEITAEFRINNKAYRGRLVNISVSGVCLDGGSAASDVNISAEVDVSIACRGKGEIAARGRVAWAARGGLLGIKFLDLDESARGLIQGCITDKSVLIQAKK